MSSAIYSMSQYNYKTLQIKSENGTYDCNDWCNPRDRTRWQLRSQQVLTLSLMQYVQTVKCCG